MAPHAFSNQKSPGWIWRNSSIALYQCDGVLLQNDRTWPFMGLSTRVIAPILCIGCALSSLADLFGIYDGSVSPASPLARIMA